jgi:serine/threonine protein kinase
MQRLPIADACEIVRQAALGLAHIHETGLIHRDIKPSNLMLCQSGVVKILDLGLVLPGDDPLSKDDRLTTVGHLMGTMPYMAPEQLADSRSVCPRADIYSLGATLFRLITGRTPHQKKGNLAAHILAITGTDAPKLSTFREDVDNELETLVSEMLSRDPNHRPDSAADIARRLEPAGNDSRLKPLLREALRRPHHSKNTASRLPSVAASQPPTRRHKWVAWAMGGFAATVLLAGFLLKLQTEKGELIVHSQQDDVTLLVKQDDQLVQRLTIESSQPGRTVLRKGTYRIEIDGGGTALQLSKDVVTIGAKQSNHLEVTKRPPNDASQATLFKGQSLDHWMSLLTREKEVDAVGQAMLAVEILTRDGHPQDRYAAAETTINLAKKHGGIAQESLDSLGSVEGRGPINNPDAFSRRFMAYFLTTIPRYFPSPGLQLIDRELRDGPQESRVASVMALNQYVAGARSGYGSSEAKRDAAESMRQFSSLPENKPLIESIGKQLLSFDSSVSNPFGPGGPAQDAAFMMMFGDGQSILGTPWAEERVQNALQRTAKRWDNTARNLRIQDNTGMGLRLIPTEYYLPSIELAKANSAEAQWDFLAEAILYDRNFRELTDDQQEQVFQSVANEASAQLLTVIENRLKELVAQSDTMEPSDTDGFGQIGFGMGRYQIPQLVVELSGQNSTWPRLLAYYANETPEPDRAIEMLEKVRWQMERHKADQIHKTGSVFNWVDDALATLQSRDKK